MPSPRCAVTWAACRPTSGCRPLSHCRYRHRHRPSWRAWPSTAAAIRAPATPICASTLPTPPSCSPCRPPSMPANCRCTPSPAVSSEWRPGGQAPRSLRVGVMRRMRAAVALPAPAAAGSPVGLVLVLILVAALVVSAAGCGGGGVLSPDLVLVNGGEPANPLIPTSTNDSNGGRILDRLFAGLMSYDASGKVSEEVAQSIETSDNVNYRVILKPGWKFTDGSPVTAHSFVDAWNYGALSTNAQLQQDFFSPIEGFDVGRTTMSGLRVVSDLEFSV